MAETYLDIVNDSGEVIDRALRSHAHANGLLHRIICIWFITPKKEIILQRRSMAKDIHPGRLTVSVGGHVDSGYDIEETAVREAQEETGVNINAADLHFLASRRKNEVDPVTKLHDNELQYIYGYAYKGRIEDLKVEPSDSDGYVIKTWDEMTNASVALMAEAEPTLFKNFIAIRDQLEKLVA